MYEPGTIVNMRAEIIGMQNLTDKDLPGGITKADLEKIPELVAVRVRMTESNVTPGSVMLVHESILSSMNAVK